MTYSKSTVEWSLLWQTAGALINNIILLIIYVVKFESKVKSVTV